MTMRDQSKQRPDSHRFGDHLDGLEKFPEIIKMYPNSTQQTLSLHWILNIYQKISVDVRESPKHGAKYAKFEFIIYEFEFLPQNPYRYAKPHMIQFTVR